MRLWRLLLVLTVSTGTWTAAQVDARAGGSGRNLRRPGRDRLRSRRVRAVRRPARPVGQLRRGPAGGRATRERRGLDAIRTLWSRWPSIDDGGPPNAYGAMTFGESGSELVDRVYRARAGGQRILSEVSSLQADLIRAAVPDAEATPARLEQEMERLHASLGAEGLPRHSWPRALYHHRGELPPRMRKAAEAMRPPSLAWTLRWERTERTLGPKASFEELRAEFEKSREHRDDGRKLTPARLAQLQRDYRFGYWHRYKNSAEHGDIDYVLARPSMPPLLRRSLTRLGGALPLAGRRVLIVGHGYSDAVPFTEALVEAGMNPLDATFYSTNYVFHPSVQAQLMYQGLTVHQFSALHHRNEAEYVKTLEHQMRALFRQSVADGKPIMMFDDGGAGTQIAARLLDDPEFAPHRARLDLRIAEQTNNGHRKADALLARRGALPFTYFSMARLPIKRRHTSPIFANRVVDRLYRHIDINRRVADQMGERSGHPEADFGLRNLKAVVFGGGGAMGLPAAERLRRDGFDVLVVEDALDSKGAREASRRGFAVTTMTTEADARRVLGGKGLVLGMVGTRMLGPEHLRYLDDGTILAQGSSKRQEFDMEGIGREAHRFNTMMTLPTVSTYLLEAGARTKRLFFMLDGFTLNHANTYHGVPIRHLDLELATYFETGMAAAQYRGPGGGIRQIGRRREKQLLSAHRATGDDRYDEEVQPPLEGGNPMELFF
ncbi:MAG TPA: hypothetical protein VMZ28_11545 [Kofleriaceae bacterium]|nr:hypothetical protein [Kofleriaceae bacterium]